MRRHRHILRLKEFRVHGRGNFDFMRCLNLQFFEMSPELLGKSPLKNETGEQIKRLLR